ncbi:peptidyl-prolyl cis-trans isomerase-like 4 [Pieris rapae]|uniref:peptidyl-prolyl cis-trans isomerase-like 4 n=1 Tax=Pieris rapae TaxID=64459 RepID=UPI001E28169C|nr:peptidyl-prolyl cis-trans isomerase-like 4 [Pieris rapae]
MAVVIETSLGDITVDLYVELRPQTCRNFLKLCKMKYYNYNLFHSIRSGFIAQTGDPTGEGSGGQSIWGVLEGPEKRFFSGEKMPKIRHSEVGLLSMVGTDDMMVGSQFFFTLAPDLNSLDGTHCVIGEVTEGHEILTKLNEVICDETHRPYRDVRITHTVILEDPFVDPPGFRAPSRSPSPNPERLKGGRIAPDEDIDETEGKTAAEIQEMIEEKEAKARATILEIVGDLPDANIAPPENVLFVCKLNPVTTDDDLEIIFSRFGKIVSCEVIRDKKTGNSLQYAFIEFDNKKSCEDAYFKMDNVLIDDRRIHVDFSQSVSKMRYLGKGRGVQYLNDDNSEADMVKKGRSLSRDRENRRQKFNHKDYDRNDNQRSYVKTDNHLIIHHIVG